MNFFSALPVLQTLFLAYTGPRTSFSDGIPGSPQVPGVGPEPQGAIPVTGGTVGEEVAVRQTQGRQR